MKPDPRNIKFKNDNLRVAGDSLDDAINDRVLKLFIVAFFAGMVLAFNIYAIADWYYNLKINPTFFSVAIIPISPFVLIYFRKLSKEIDNYIHGRKGERLVSKLLNGLGVFGAYVIDDIPIVCQNGNKFNIDHVLISPYGLYCIETKINLYGKYKEDAIDEAGSHSYYLDKVVYNELNRNIKSIPTLIFAKKKTHKIEDHRDKENRLVKVSNIRYFAGSFKFKKDNEKIFSTLEIQDLKNALDRYCARCN